MARITSGLSITVGVVGSIRDGSRRCVATQDLLDQQADPVRFHPRVQDAAPGVPDSGP
jgi:hypothetical protein